MRQLKFFIAISVLLLTGCASEIHQKIKLDIPAYSPLKIQEFQEIIFIPFLISTKTPEIASSQAQENLKKGEKEEKERSITAQKNKTEPELDAQAEVTRYFVVELSRKFKGRIRQESNPLTSAELIHKPDYWQSLTNSPTGLIFTGTGHFQEEIRKAFLYRSDFYRVEEGEELFGPEKKLASRHVFTLELTVALIKPETGEVILERNFKETKMTPDLKYPARFALYELLQRIKLILFRQIFGEERPQERYLLFK